MAFQINNEAPTEQSRVFPVTTISESHSRTNFLSFLGADSSNSMLATLQAELNSLADRPQRCLAAATHGGIGKVQKKWNMSVAVSSYYYAAYQTFRFCHEISKGRSEDVNPDDALEHADLFFLKAFFVWYKLGHSKAQRINTFVFLWGTLRQLYYNRTASKLEDQGQISRVSRMFWFLLGPI